MPRKEKVSNGATKNGSAGVSISLTKDGTALRGSRVTMKHRELAEVLVCEQIENDEIGTHECAEGVASVLTIGHMVKAQVVAGAATDGRTTFSNEHVEDMLAFGRHTVQSFKDLDREVIALRAQVAEDPDPDHEKRQRNQLALSVRIEEQTKRNERYSGLFRGSKMTTLLAQKKKHRESPK
jgi:hypothetical protein